MSQLNVGKLVASTGVKLQTYTTATRPTPEVGLMIYNSDIAGIEIYTGDSWFRLGGDYGKVSGTWSLAGGSTGNSFQDGNYMVHYCTAGSGTFTVQNAGPEAAIEVLVVAGGGGTGNDVGGGGGGGGIIHDPKYEVTAGSVYSFSVGGGGASYNRATVNGNNKGDNGGNSTFGTYTALGGGGGGAYPNDATSGPGVSGGSGGGGGDNGYDGGSGTKGNSNIILNQGYDGGRSASSAWGSGAGGSKMGRGEDGETSVSGASILGGSRYACSITGTLEYFGGGGYGNSDGGTVRPTGQDYGGNVLYNTAPYGFGANGTGSPNASPYDGAAGFVAIRYPIRKLNVVKYETAGTFSWTPPAGVSSVAVLVVGGGGQGGCGSGGGGGGGGGLVFDHNVSVTAGSPVTVIVGDGGEQYQSSSSVKGANGQDSYFGNIRAYGGGGGGSEGNRVGENGGCGGGGCFSSGNSLALGTQGGRGGRGGPGSNDYGGGGGGGAGGDGLRAGSGFPPSVYGGGGDGGAGYPCAITGDIVYYAGGGGGGAQNSGGGARVGVGGIGGGGDGASYDGNSGYTGVQPVPGIDGLGGGGGGAKCCAPANQGARGGCGCVIIAY